MLSGLVYGYDNDGEWYFNSKGEQPEESKRPPEKK